MRLPSKFHNMKNNSILVGSEFKPGAEGNAQIDRALGFEAEVFAGVAQRRFKRAIDGIQWHPCPDYCGDDTLAYEMLEVKNVLIFILKGRLSPKSPMHYVAVMEADDKLYHTPQFEASGYAAACAVWYVATELSHK